MKNPNSIPLEKQKEIMIRLLDSLIVFLDSNSLDYSLAFGTLIGAVRHNGFIPWDDDIDIAMPYEDYKKMVKLLSENRISDNIEFSCHETNPNHLWAFGKVYDTTTKLDETIFIKKYANRQDSMKYGLYIDIFPIYPVPDDPKAQMELERMIKHNYKKLIWSSRKVVFPKGIKNTFKKCIYNICFIPYRLIGMDHYLTKHDQLISSFVNENTNTVCCNLSTDHYSFFSKDTFLDKILVPFESIEAKIPANYDFILKQMYGDYMALPPENQRRFHMRHVEYR